MPIDVSPSMRRLIRQYPDGFVVQVQRPSEYEAACEALEKATREIAAFDGGWQAAPGLAPGDRTAPAYIGCVMPVPSGPAVYIDGGHTPDELLASIPDVVARHLVALNVNDAVIAPPQEDESPIWDLPVTERAVVLRIYPSPTASQFLHLVGKRPKSVL